MSTQGKSTTGQGLPADELGKLQRQLLAKAVAIILSPEWGKPTARPADSVTEERSNGT